MRDDFRNIIKDLLAARARLENELKTLLPNGSQIVADCIEEDLQAIWNALDALGAWKE